MRSSPYMHQASFCSRPLEDLEPRAAAVVRRDVAGRRERHVHLRRARVLHARAAVGLLERDFVARSDGVDLGVGAGRRALVAAEVVLGDLVVHDRHVGARVLSDVLPVGADQFVVDDELREGVVRAGQWRGGDCQGQELVAVELHRGWIKPLPEF